MDNLTIDKKLIHCYRILIHLHSAQEAAFGGVASGPNYPHMRIPRERNLIKRGGCGAARLLSPEHARSAGGQLAADPR